MPSRQINALLQKRKQNKIELVARPKEYLLLSQKLSSASVFYADALASNGSPDDRHDNVYLISGEGDSTAVALNDAVLAATSKFLKSILEIHQTLPEPPEDRLVQVHLIQLIRPYRIYFT